MKFETLILTLTALIIALLIGSELKSFATELLKVNNVDKHKFTLAMK